jgi:hypothetical protein
MHILLVFFLASFEYVSNESSTFQMSDNTQNDSRGVGGSGDVPLPPPPPMTPVEAFIAAQTEVLRQILQTQQQVHKNFSSLCTIKAIFRMGLMQSCPTKNSGQ